MGEASDSIEVTCPKCRKKFQEPDSGFHDEPSTRCPGCGYHVFSDHETIRRYHQAREKRDAEI